MFEIAEAEPAPVCLHGNAVEAERAHRRPQFIARKPVIAVSLRGQRRDLLIGKAARRLADHLGAFAKLEIELWGSAHELSFSTAAHSNLRRPRKPVAYAGAFSRCSPHRPAKRARQGP